MLLVKSFSIDRQQGGTFASQFVGLVDNAKKFRATLRLGSPEGEALKILVFLDFFFGRDLSFDV